MPAIRCEGLSKQYRIGERESYKALRDVIADAASAPFRRLRTALGNGNGISIKNQKSEIENYVWALEDVSFEVKRGEVVGIIGRNGAGKSTLLKILSRITKPTRGQAEIHGRVGSLLEVGTGFHPELTGRENIYLNAAILGMRKTEVARKFDEIIAFAEVEKFVDTPVKRYSSGMYVRLAFAVAAHLEPEILIVDEVLAVGDAAFQKKCLGKLGEVAQGGRTVLFVSHNMAAIQNLSSHCIYLKDGRNRFEGPVESVVREYLNDIEISASQQSINHRKDRGGNGRVRVVDFYVLDKKSEKQNALRAGQDYVLVMEYEKSNPDESISNVVGSIAFTDAKNEMVFLVRSTFTNENFSLPKGRFGKIECHIKDLNLTKGTYNSYLFLSQADFEVLDKLEHATQVTVEGGDFFGTGSLGLPQLCKVLTRSSWSAS